MAAQTAAIFKNLVKLASCNLTKLSFSVAAAMFVLLIRHLAEAALAQVVSIRGKECTCYTVLFSL